MCRPWAPQTSTTTAQDQTWQNASPVDSGLQACKHPNRSLRKQRGRNSGSSGDPVRLDLRGEASNAATTKWALTLFRTSPTSGIRAHTHYTETGGCHGGLERRRGYRGPREEEEKRREEEEKRGRGRGGEGERRQEEEEEDGCGGGARQEEERGREQVAGGEARRAKAEADPFFGLAGSKTQRLNPASY